ncbi:MAG: hypothetical protein ACFFD8_05015 [Candidatus Thorarchaeota archaeon]
MMEAIGIVNRVQDHNGKAPDRRWAAYIEAMRGPLSSIPPDSHKIDAKLAGMRAEARFFEGRNQRSVNRSAFHLTKMLKRQSG